MIIYNIIKTLKPRMKALLGAPKAPFNCKLPFLRTTIWAHFFGINAQTAAQIMHLCYISEVYHPCDFDDLLIAHKSQRPRDGQSLTLRVRRFAHRAQIAGILGWS